MPVTVALPGPWTHRDLTAGGTRFHVALAGPEEPLAGAGTDSDPGAGGTTEGGTVPPVEPRLDAPPSQPMVLLVHGFPECGWTWRHVIGPLADAGHRVAAVDLRGFGGSDRPPSGYDLVTLASDLAAVVRALGHERAVVVGAGLGGQVAWMLASREPATVAAVAPVGAPHPLALRSLRGRIVSGAALQYLWLKTPGLPERSLRTTAGVERLLRSWAGPRTRQAAAEQAGFYAALMARPGAAHSALETVRRTILSHAEATCLDNPVTVPVMSVQGEQDPLQPAQAYARDTHHVAGHLRQVTVRGVGHFPQEEAPDRLIDIILPFLIEIGRGL